MKLIDDSIFTEIYPTLPTVPETDETPNLAELIYDRYYYLLSSPELSQFSNAWKFLANSDASPIAKWIEVGTPTYYNDYPFSLSILSTLNIAQKNEKTRQSNDTLIADNDTSLLDTYNSFLRIMLTGDYTDVTKYIDVKLTGGGDIIVNHFVDANPFNGLVWDFAGNQDGQLIDSNCLNITDYANTKIRLPEIISIDSTSLSKNTYATATITATNNEISFTANGTLFELEFKDTDGNNYEFPLCERYINIDDLYSYLLHGMKYEAGTGTKTHIYAWFDGGSFTQQSYYHWMAVYGGDVNINQSDTSEKIWTQKDRSQTEMYTKGVDSDFYNVDLLPIV